MAAIKKGLAGRAALGAVCAATLLATTAGTAFAGSSCSTYAYGLKGSLGPFKVGKVAKSAYPSGPPKAYVAKASFPSVGTVEGIGSTATGNAKSGATQATARIAGADLDLRLATVSTAAVSTTCDAAPGRAPRATARVTNGSVSASMGGRTVNFPANPAPNTRVTLPGGLGEATLNEQIRNRDGSLTVNAVHFRFASSAPYQGDLVLASSTCEPLRGSQPPGIPPKPQPPKPGEPQEPGQPQPRLAMITPTAYNTSGDRVPGVAFELKRPKPSGAAPSCTGNNKGSCTFKDLKAGTYKVCVIDVPDGYDTPKKPCKGDIKVKGKEHRHVKFTIPDDRGKKN